MRIENLHWDANRIWIPEGKTEKARRFVAMSERTKSMLRQWCGERKEGWIFPSSRSKSGHLTTIAKGFQAARDQVGLDRKLVPIIPLGTPMEHTRWTRAATRSPSPSPWAMLTSSRWSRTNTKSWNRCEKSSISVTNEKSLVRFSKMTQIEQAGLSRCLRDRTGFELVDAVGIEPTTCRLRVECSAS
jgi:hypothetical protein